MDDDVLVQRLAGLLDLESTEYAGYHEPSNRMHRIKHTPTNKVVWTRRHGVEDNDDIRGSIAMRARLDHLKKEEIARIILDYLSSGEMTCRATD